MEKLNEAIAAVNGAPVQPVCAAVTEQVEAMRRSALEAENAALRAALAAAKAKQARTSRLSLKVSEKGAVSVYGLGRFPVTLYQEQMLRLLDMADEIRAFVKDNAGVLAVKGG